MKGLLLCCKRLFCLIESSETYLCRSTCKGSSYMEKGCKRSTRWYNWVCFKRTFDPLMSSDELSLVVFDHRKFSVSVHLFFSPFLRLFTLNNKQLVNHIQEMLSATSVPRSPPGRSPLQKHSCYTKYSRSARPSPQRFDLLSQNSTLPVGLRPGYWRTWGPMGGKAEPGTASADLLFVNCRDPRSRWLLSDATNGRTESDFR